MPLQPLLLNSNNRLSKRRNSLLNPLLPSSTTSNLRNSRHPRCRLNHSSHLNTGRTNSRPSNHPYNSKPRRPSKFPSPSPRGLRIGPTSSSSNRRSSTPTQRRPTRLHTPQMPSRARRSISPRRRRKRR